MPPAALVCVLTNELGTFEAGKLAGVPVVNGNPLQDVQALTSVQFVIHNGVINREENE